MHAAHEPSGNALAGLHLWLYRAAPRVCSCLNVTRRAREREREVAFRGKNAANSGLGGQMSRGVWTLCSLPWEAFLSGGQSWIPAALRLVCLKKVHLISSYRIFFSNYSHFSLRWWPCCICFMHLQCIHLLLSAWSRDKSLTFWIVSSLICFIMLTTV